MSSLPQADAVAKMLSTFVRRPVSVKEVPVPDRLPILGFYHGGSNHNVAVCECDVAFAAYSAAAFALIPAAVAKDSVKDGRLEDSLEEIYAEVLNVLSRAFADTEGERITLRDKVFPPAPIPEFMAQRPAGGEIGLAVEIDGYGKGTLVLGILEAV